MALTQFSPIAGYYHGVLAATDYPAQGFHFFLTLGYYPALGLYSAGKRTQVRCINLAHSETILRKTGA